MREQIAHIAIETSDFISRGAGVLVAPSLLLTALHVVADRKSVPVRFYAEAIPVEVGSRRLSAHVVEDCYDATYDWALLKVTPSIETAPMPIRILAESQLQNRWTPMRWSGFGFPVGTRHGVACGGEVRTTEGYLDGAPAIQLFSLDAAAGTGEPVEGYSGSPVIVNGFVVGIIRAAQMSSPGIAEAGRLYACSLRDIANQSRGRLNAHLIHALAEDPYSRAFDEFLEGLQRFETSPYLNLELPDKTTLSEVYVPLEIRNNGRDGSLAEVLRQSVDPQGRRLLVLGAPGAGKSTLLYQLARSAWDNPAKIGLERPYLPMVVPLQSLARSRGTSTEERIVDALGIAGISVADSPLPPGFFTDWSARFGAPWLLMFDGLDEVESAMRPDVVRWLSAIPSKHHVIVTSRPLLSAPLGRFEVVELRSLSKAQQTVIAGRWIGDRAEQFMTQLAGARVGLVDTPLFLTIALDIYRTSGQLPRSRAALYDRFVEKRWRESLDRGILDELGSDVGPLENQPLQHLAILMTECALAPKRGELIAALSTFVGSQPGFPAYKADATAARMLDVLSRRSGLLTVAGDAIEWIHPTFREFFAAKALARLDADSDRAHAYLRRFEDVRWRQVLLFVLTIWSERRDVTNCLKRLQAGAAEAQGGLGSRETQALMFVGEALANGVFLASDYSRDVVRTIADVLLSRAPLRWTVAALGARAPASYLEEPITVRPRELIAKFRQYGIESETVEALGSRLIEIASTDERGSTYALSYDIPEILGRPGLEALINNRENSLLVRQEAASNLVRMFPDENAAEIFIALAFDRYATERSRSELVGSVYGDKRVAVLGAIGADARTDQALRNRISDILATKCDSREVDRLLADQAGGALDVAVSRAKDAGLVALLNNIDELASNHRLPTLIDIAETGLLAPEVRVRAAAHAWRLTPNGDLARRLSGLLDGLDVNGGSREEMLKLCANVMSYLGQWRAAIETLDELVGIVPSDAWARAMRGNCYRNEGEWANAYDDLTRSLELGGPDAWDYVRRGCVLYEQGEHSLAVADFERAIALETGEEWFYGQFGDSLFRCDRYRDALTVLTRAVKLNPDDPFCRSLKGSALFQLGLWKVANRELRRASVLDPSDKYAPQLLERSLLYLGEYGAAIGAASATEGDLKVVRVSTGALVECLLAARDVARAGELLCELRSVLPNEPWFAYLAGIHAQLQGDQSAATERFTEALRLSHDHERDVEPRVVSNRALYRVALGLLEEGERGYSKLVANGFVVQLLSGSLPELGVLSQLWPSRSDVAAVRDRLERAVYLVFPATRHDHVLSLSWRTFREAIGRSKQAGSDESRSRSRRRFRSSSRPRLSRGSRQRQRREQHVHRRMLRRPYSFPTYSDTGPIMGLQREEAVASELIRAIAAGQPAMAVLPLDRPDRIFGRCNFVRAESDSDDYRFCDTVEVFLNSGVASFVHNWGLRSLVFNDPELRERFRIQLEARNITSVECIDGRKAARLA